MRKLIAISLLVPAALCLFVAGCGGGEDDAEAGPIDKATFVKRANKICEQVSGKLAAEVNAVLNRESAKPDYDLEQTQVVLVKTALIPGLEAELKEIRGLGTPPQGAEEIEAFYRAAQKVIDSAKAETRAFSKSAAVYEPAELAGAKFGLTSCPIAAVSG